MHKYWLVLPISFVGCVVTSIFIHSWVPIVTFIGFIIVMLVLSAIVAVMSKKCDHTIIVVNNCKDEQDLLHQVLEHSKVDEKLLN